MKSTPITSRVIHSLAQKRASDNNSSRELDAAFDAAAARSEARRAADERGDHLSKDELARRTSDDIYREATYEMNERHRLEDDWERLREAEEQRRRGAAKQRVLGRIAQESRHGAIGMIQNQRARSTPPTQGGRFDRDKIMRGLVGGVRPSMGAAVRPAIQNPHGSSTVQPNIQTQGNSGGTMTTPSAMQRGTSPAPRTPNYMSSPPIRPANPINKTPVSAPTSNVPEANWGMENKAASFVGTSVRAKLLHSLSQKKASGDAPYPGHSAHAVQTYAPIAKRRELSPVEEQLSDRESRKVIPKIFQTKSDPIPVRMSSPGVASGALGTIGAALGGLAGGLVGSGVDAARGSDGEKGNTYAIAGAATGATVLGSLFGLLGYHGKRQSNENLREAMRRLPEGATIRDLESDPVYQRNLDRMALIAAAGGGGAISRI